MGWSIGYDDNLQRDIGYGVPAYCDHPDCTKEIHRGLSYVCGGDAYGGEHGCGMHFCSSHLLLCLGSDPMPQLCERCVKEEPHFPIKPDHPEWIQHKETDPSWEEWRQEQARLKNESHSSGKS